jgi:HD superfamily phosphodiesterase
MSPVTDFTVEARELSRQLVAPLGRRWCHVQAVAARAAELADAVPVEDRDTLVASVWLHDIGDAPDLAVTGLHPVDGARYLRDHDGRRSSWAWSPITLAPPSRPTSEDCSAG